jgi:hypothetical protein
MREGFWVSISMNKLRRPILPLLALSAAILAGCGPGKTTSASAPLVPAGSAPGVVAANGPNSAFQFTPAQVQAFQAQMSS